MVPVGLEQVPATRQIARRPMWILEINELGADRFVVRNTKQQHLLEYKIKK